MPEQTKSRRGGARAGAGRKPNKFVQDRMAIDGKSRATMYRIIMRGERLTTEALAFAVDPNHRRKITGKALDIATYFDNSNQQIEILKLAMTLRVAHKKLTHTTAIMHLSSLNLI